MKIFDNPTPNLGYFYVLKKEANYSLCFKFHWAMARNGSYGPEIEPITLRNTQIEEMYKREVELDESRPDICHGWIASLFKDIFIEKYRECLRVMK